MEFEGKMAIVLEGLRGRSRWLRYAGGILKKEWVDTSAFAE